jgi:hypothetical protein
MKWAPDGSLETARNLAPFFRPLRVAVSPLNGLEPSCKGLQKGGKYPQFALGNTAQEGYSMIFYGYIDISIGQLQWNPIFCG